MTKFNDQTNTCFTCGMIQDGVNNFSTTDSDLLIVKKQVFIRVIIVFLMEVYGKSLNILVIIEYLIVL